MRWAYGTKWSYLDLWIVCFLIRVELERGREERKVSVCVCCICSDGVAELGDNEGEKKENMIEWDILSAADVSWSLDWGVCFAVCVSVGVYQSLSHPAPIFFTSLLAFKGSYMCQC